MTKKGNGNSTAYLETKLERTPTLLVYPAVCSGVHVLPWEYMYMATATTSTMGHEIRRCSQHTCGELLPVAADAQ